ncbi:hypothetical protein ON010_g6047 [Phytophthora cinnamomi]|nr:hypothetical protein ON010_g6047 [Phytophthora cinnamomi]
MRTLPALVILERLLRGDGAIHAESQHAAVDNETNAAENVIRNSYVRVLRAIVRAVDVFGQVEPATDDEAQGANECAERCHGPPAEDVPDPETRNARVLVSGADEENLYNSTEAKQDAPCHVIAQGGERAEDLTQLRAVVIADVLDEVEVGTREEVETTDHEAPTGKQDGVAVPFGRVLRIERSSCGMRQPVGPKATICRQEILPVGRSLDLEAIETNVSTVESNTRNLNALENPDWRVASERVFEDIRDPALNAPVQ